MLNKEKLIQDFKDALGWPYVSPGGTGKDCSKTGIDCSGMFVRAYKLQGASIYHGSNHIWRDGSLSDKGKLTSVNQLEVGMAVFKWSKSGEPTRYASDGLGNFHHIGLVTSVTPLNIVHASTVGYIVKTSTSITGWTHWGKLASVTYSADTQQDTTDDSKNTDQATHAKVNGGKLNLRATPSKNATRLLSIPDGMDVCVLEETNDTWWRVCYSGTNGYVMCRYLTIE